MSVQTIPSPPAMKLALDANFGSFERWRDDFVACASAHGSGRTLLAFLPTEGTLLNQWAAEDAQPRGIPILALDMRGQGAVGIDAFVGRIDWGGVYQRYQTAVHDASEPYAAERDSLAGALVLDVRRAGVFEQADSMIPGARWRDPKSVGEWSHELPRGQPVVVYCVYGHEVGRSTAMRLRAAGLDAQFLRGGIDGWIASGRLVSERQRG